MGGTGVASSHYCAAALANPALMTSATASDDFSMILPSVGVQVSDPDHLQSDVDAVKDAWDRYDAALSGAVAPLGAATDLQHQLEKFKNTQVNVLASVGMVATVPNSQLPFALILKSWGTATVAGKVSDHDLQYLDDVTKGKIIPTASDTDTLTSRAYGRAAAVSDVGIAIARTFETNGLRYSLGVTPKYQRVDLFNYNTTVQNYDSHDFRSHEYRNNTPGINADIGFATELNEHWMLGLAGQNIVPRSIDTKEVNGLKETFRIRPQVTAGGSWHNGIVTTALDVDLTPASGFTHDTKRQFAAMGAEVNAWNWVQLRAGYRQNIASSEGSAFTAGIGISPFNMVHLDLAGLVGTDRTYGAVAQLSETF
ncbi:conjugal transfer protein TraF [Escherichia sp. E14V7]|nr:conjugal transfer protein TraF [Escherichia sp. E14V5]RZN00814.1 conjugal transfer protein TraF [Escherichia sp. E14V7]RZN18262.1 conjugal transfer protein TraF [Escherichia sp. E14S1]RZN23724.1 conjugal transfer protein TraF [Escherichia sp. E14V10]